jgi:hypothetical protein
MQFYLLVYRDRLKSKRQSFYIFLKSFDMEKNKKLCFQAKQMKMADESNMAAKTFFSDSNFKNDNSSKKTFLLYFLTNNTTLMQQFFF